MALRGNKSPSKLIAFSVIAVSAIFVFLPNLSSEFILDDNILIKDNPFIRQLETVSTYLAQEDGILDRHSGNENYHTGYYRPLINFTYHLDYRLWGLNPAGFHLTNWLLHLLTSVLLYHILFRVSGIGWASLLTALLFALHPVQTEAVSWVSSRNNILATLFSLASFHFYIVRHAHRYFFNLLLSVIFFILAVFSKEFGVMLLPIIFIYDRIIQKQSFLPDKSWRVYLPFGMALCIYLLARGQVTGSLLGVADNVPFIQRLIFAPYLIMYNLRLVLLPVGLHSFVVSYPNEQILLPAVGGFLGMVLIGSLIWRFRNDKLLVFGVLSFIAGIFPVLNLIPTSASSLVSMRWLYFPLAFLSFAICRMAGDQPGRLKIVGLVTVVVFLGTYSFYLNRVHWHDEKGFFTREVLQFNNHLYAGGYARILHESGRHELADMYFQRAIKTFPSMVNNYVDYSAMLIDNNQPRKALAVIEKGMRCFGSKGDMGILYNNMGMALLKLDGPGAAIASFEAAVKHSPRNTGFLSNLGSTYGMVSQYNKSVEILHRGLTIEPDSIGIRKNLANSYIKLGEYAKAIQILEVIPDNVRIENPGIEKLLRQALSSWKREK